MIGVRTEIYQHKELLMHSKFQFVELKKFYLENRLMWLDIARSCLETYKRTGNKGFVEGAKFAGQRSLEIKIKLENLEKGIVSES